MCLPLRIPFLGIFYKKRAVCAGLLLLCAHVLLRAQIPVDTSYTIYSNHQKLKKSYPFVEPIAPALPEQVRAMEGQSYKTIQGRALQLDIYFPASTATGPVPGILLIHGGGWASGSRAHQVPMAQQLAARGYVAAAVSYRLSPEAPYPAAVHDLKEAVRWLRANANQFNLDTTQIAALGCSAGGHLASLLGTTNAQSSFDESTAFPGVSSAVQAVLNIDGIVSFVHSEARAEGSAAARWLGGSREEAFAVWKEASPLEYAGAQTPPFLFVNSAMPRFHAGRDDLIRVLNRYSIYSEVHTIPETPHSFWLVHPWFRPTLEYVAGFLNRVFKHAPASEDEVAERMLAYQRACGGWPKSYFTPERKEIRIDYTKPLTEGPLDTIRADSLQLDATFDNSATSKEILYLINAYHQTANLRYLRAAERGIQYMLEAQYAESGGWPQYFPLKKGYYSHITFNDQAMINILNILYDVANRLNGFEAVDPALIEPCKGAVEKGIQCILKTQIKKNDTLMVWCAQHDPRTLLPAKARAFELESFSGQESVGITRFLMRLEHPAPEVIQAIEYAVRWFEHTKIEGFSYVEVPDTTYTPRGIDRVFRETPGAVSWARFYDLETNTPFFCGRDSIKKKAVHEIEQERRVGYAWYGDWAKNLLQKDYPKWRKRVGI